MEFKILVNKDKISAQNIMLNTGNVNFYECKFHFSSEWNDLEKFAVFIKGDENYLVRIESDKCTVPAEVLESEEYVSLGVFGTKGSEDDYVRISTDEIKILLGKGAYAEGVEPEVPTPEIWESYVGQMSTALKKAVPIIGENGNWYVWDVESESYIDSGFASRGEDAEELTFDQTPTEGSENPVTSGGVYKRIDEITLWYDKVIGELEENVGDIDTAVKNISNLENGEASDSVQQKLDADNWYPAGQYIINAVAENLSTVDGMTISANEDGSVNVGAYGENSMMINGMSQTVGKRTFASGTKSIAFENNSVAVGNGVFAMGQNSHAQNHETTAAGLDSSAKGYQTVALGEQSDAKGLRTIAKGKHSSAEGVGTIAGGNDQHVQGDYNIEDNGIYAHIVGNGKSDTERSNAHTLDWDGNAWFAGDVKAGDVSLKGLSESVGDIDTAIDNIIAIQEILMFDDATADGGVEYDPFEPVDPPINEY